MGEADGERERQARLCRLCSLMVSSSSIFSLMSVKQLDANLTRLDTNVTQELSVPRRIPQFKVLSSKCDLNLSLLPSARPTRRPALTTSSPLPTLPLLA